MGKKRSGVVKKILKDHFDGYWKFHHDRFPKEIQNDIKETVEKAMKGGEVYDDISSTQYNSAI